MNEKVECLLSNKIMGAKELFDAREAPVLPEIKGGQKGYYPKEHDEENVDLNGHFESMKKFLSQERVARAGDLMQAKWDSNLKKSVTKKLKGKFTQHMGQNVRDEIHLSPEETMFLAENGFLELSINNDVPLSIEEVHYTVLKGSLAATRYKVYSYLSRHGYIVVPHKETLCPTTSSNSKEREKRKKKVSDSQVPCKKPHMETSQDIHKETSQESFDVCDNMVMKDTTNSVTTIESNDESQDTSAQESLQDKACDVSIDEAKSNNSESNSLSGSNVSLNQESKEDNKDQEGPNLSKVDKVVPEEQRRPDVNATTVVDDTSLGEHSIESDNPVSKASENAVSSNSLSDSNNWAENELDFSSILPDIILPQENENPIDVCNNKAVEMSKDQTTDDSNFRNSDNSTEQENAFTSEDDPDEIEDTNEDDSNEPVFRIDTDSTDEEDEDGKDNNTDEILFVEVTKTVKEPLAVIDLSSDDEDTSKNDEDDIQFVGEFKSSLSNSSQRRPKKEKKNIRRFKNEHSRSRTTNNASNDWAFPNFLKKSVVCLPRPPPHLLPPNVRPAKEAYTMEAKSFVKSNHLQKTSRYWNSYRDLQRPRAPFWQGNESQRVWDSPPPQFFLPSSQYFPMFPGPIIPRPMNSTFPYMDMTQRLRSPSFFNPYPNSLSPRPPWNRDSYGAPSWTHNGQPSSLPFSPITSPHSMPGPMFPCSIPRIQENVASWRQFKSVVYNSDESDEDGVIEVPIEVDDVLWSNKVICPLTKQEAFDNEVVSTALRVTKSAKLLTDKFCTRFLPSTCSLEIAFDVYLPGTVYKKTQPAIPHHRIVVCSGPNLPRASEITLLLRKFSDSASLKFVAVNEGEMLFFCFDYVSLPTV